MAQYPVHWTTQSTLHFYLKMVFRNLMLDRIGITAVIEKSNTFSQCSKQTQVYTVSWYIYTNLIKLYDKNFMLNLKS